MTLKEIESLGIFPVTDEVYLKHLKEHQLRGQDVSQWEFYKDLDGTLMFYSRKYLEETSYKECKDKQQAIMKRPSKWSTFTLRIELWWYKHIGKYLR